MDNRKQTQKHPRDRPEAAALVLFPVLQGRNGGCLCGSRFRNPNPRPSEVGGRPGSSTKGRLWSRSLSRSLGSFISVDVGWRGAESKRSARDGRWALLTAVAWGGVEGLCGACDPGVEVPELSAEPALATLGFATEGRYRVSGRRPESTAVGYFAELAT